MKTGTEQDVVQVAKNSINAQLTKWKGKIYIKEGKGQILLLITSDVPTTFPGSWLCAFPLLIVRVATF